MRLPEVDLQHVSALKGTEFVTNKFKDGNEVEKALILNCYSHGYYSGWRFAERKPWFWEKTDSPNYVVDHSIKAAHKYIKVKKHTRLSFGQNAIIRACFGLAFQRGFGERKP